MMRAARITAAVCGLAVLSLARVSSAQQTQPNSPVTTPTDTPPLLSAMPSTDRQFVVAALQGSAAELGAAQMAILRTANDQVHGFAAKMIAEHGEIDLDGDPLFATYHETAPKLAAPDVLGLRRLDQASAVDFDQQYALMQVGDHLAALTAFQTEATLGADPALRAFAAKWAPTIQAHLTLAIGLAKHVAGDSPLR